MTSGEFNAFETAYLPADRYVDGVQAHILAPLGLNPNGYDQKGGWCKPGLSTTKEHMTNFVRRANRVGCLVTVDVGIDERGHIDPEQLELLKYVQEHA